MNNETGNEQLVETNINNRVESLESEINRQKKDIRQLGEMLFTITGRLDDLKKDVSELSRHTID